MAKVRTVRAAEDSVMAEINRWCNKFPRINELWEGFIWRLSREPERGYKFSDGIPDFLFKVQRPTEHFPSITVLYTYDENEIIIFGIKIIPQL